MSDIETSPRKPGPWDATPAPSPAPSPARDTVSDSAVVEPAEKDQSLVWALISTGLMAGFLWWISGSVVVAAAVLVGLFVH